MSRKENRKYRDDGNLSDREAREARKMLEEAARKMIEKERREREEKEGK